jgi:hypothetical protein
MIKSLIFAVALAVSCLGLIGCGGSSSSALGTPVISGISPASVAPGGSIVITGTGLSGTYTTATFALANNSQYTYNAIASSGSTTSVTIAVPTRMVAGTYNVTVSTTDSLGDQSGSSNIVSITVT